MVGTKPSKLILRILDDMPLCSCGLSRRWRMQPGSVYSNLPNRPLKVCPVSLLPAPSVA